jgi:hypothetical protein
MRTTIKIPTAVAMEVTTTAQKEEQQQANNNNNNIDNKEN